MNPLAYKLHTEIQRRLKQTCFLFPIVEHYRFQLNDLRYIDVSYAELREDDFDKYIGMFDEPKDTPPAKKKRGRPSKKKVKDD